MPFVNIKYEDILYNLLHGNIPVLGVKNVAILLSGGLDSSIVLSLLMEYYDVTAYTVGTKGSKDITNAIEVAEYFSIKNHHIIYLNKSNVKNAMNQILKKYPNISIVDLSFEIPYYIAISNIKEKHVFTGQGSDELFGGYKKYEKNPDLMEKDILRLFTTVLPREQDLAEQFGKVLHTPFISNEIVMFSMSLPTIEKIDFERKVIVRKLARKIGLPENVIQRKKIAMQYGSGAMRILREIAKENVLDVKISNNHNL